MPCKTGNASGNSADHINSPKGPSAEKRFAQHSEIPKAPHIQRNVDDADVEEHVGDQTPPLTGHGQASPIRSPPNQRLSSRISNGDAIHHHRHENQEIDSHQYLCKPKSTATSTGPRHRHNRLSSI